MSTTACGKYRSSFSAYLDGNVSGKEMQAIAHHLGSCESCRTEFESMREMQQTLALLGPAKAPADLGTRLRVAISHEAAARRANWIDALSVKWDNALRPMLLQVSAGFATSVAFIGGIVLLLGAVAAPTAVKADDEPIMGGMSGPHYRYSAVMPRPIILPHDEAIVVEALVNNQGRVYDYKILSGPEDLTVRNQILDQLTLSVFEPARVFGAPVRGRVILTFAGISVQA